MVTGQYNGQETEKFGIENEWEWALKSAKKLYNAAGCDAAMRRCL